MTACIRRGDELCRHGSAVLLGFALLMDHAGKRRSILIIQVRIDLIEQIKRRRIAALDGKDNSQGHHSLLTTGQETKILKIFGVLASE